MKKTFLSILTISSIALIIISCNNQTRKNNDNVEVITAEKEQAILASPPAIIYKTKADYDSLVPMVLSKEGDRIVSYPSVKDLTYKGKLSYPTKLANGFLLDNRGITEKVAFLELTYKDYKKLEKTPTPEELMEMILDDDPLEAMYFCGSRGNYKDLIEDLNKIILSEDFSDCSKLK